MTEDEFFTICFKGMEGNELAKHLEFIEPLRQRFYKELRGNDKELRDFMKSNPKAFIIIRHDGYLLGKYIDVEGQEKPVPAMLISEVYVKPEARDRRLGTTMIEMVQRESWLRDCIVLLGCDKTLETYYNLLGFSKLDLVESSPDFLLMALGTDKQKEQVQFQLLS